MDKGLVGVHHLLHVDGFLAVVSEGSVLVESTIKSGYLLCIRFLVEGDHLSAEDASCEIPTIRDEIQRDALGRESFVEGVHHVRSGGGTQLVECLANLMQMLMREELVDTEIVVSPAEMCSRAGFLSSPCAACDGVDADIMRQQSSLCQGEESQLDAGGETARIGDVLRLTDLS